MTDRFASTDSRLATRLALARAALIWERVWPECWPAAAVLGAFLVVALFDLLPELPGLWHSAILLAFGAAFITAARGAIGGVVDPGLGAARRRIERASGLEHRPLQGLDDRPATPLDPAALRLWQAHRQRMQAALGRLRIGAPLGGFAARDPRGLRAVLTIFLLLGAIDAGGDWRDRLWRALTPVLDNSTPAIAASFDIWATPPEYTGLPPQFLRRGETGTILIPTGSVVLAQMHGGNGVPRLTIDGSGRDFVTIDKENFQLSEKLTRGTHLEVDQSGAVLGSWAIQVIPDRPPQIAFAEPPTPTAQGALRIAYKASDDYGVADVKAVITRPKGKLGQQIVLDLPLPALRPKTAVATAYNDLTAHPWAGLPVEIRLVATDVAGQRSESKALPIVLPERIFHNPVARAIVDQRKELVKDPSTGRTVAEILGDLRLQTTLYGNDDGAFLDLRVAQESLRHDSSAQSPAQIEQLLWDTALRIEGGQAPLALQQLRRLERELQNALANKAPDQKIDRLMGELQQALDRYLRTLAQDLARHPELQGEPNQRSQTVTSRDLQHMLDEARQLARAGARDQAQALLAQLQNMLENLRPMNPQQAGQGSSETAQTMRDMRDLMRRQQQLLDRSFRAEQQTEPGSMRLGQQPDGTERGGREGLGDAAAKQDALHGALGEMMRRLGDGNGAISYPLGRAEQAMRDAAAALRAGQPDAAIPPQTDALEELRRATSAVARQLQRQFGGGMGIGEDRGAEDAPGAGIERDPLGRPLPTHGGYDEGDVKIPAWNTLQQSRKILDELRRRAGEAYRPTQELDYIDRLLQQF